MKKMIGSLLIFSVVIAGCSSDEDELLDFYNAFQETVEVEKEIEEVTATFDELEAEKAELQQSLESAPRDELTEISGQLVENADARIAQLDEEVAIMGESRSRMEASEQYISEISNESNREKAQSLVDAMDQRYNEHGDMIGSYKTVLESERDIFEYLGDEDISQDEVDERLNNLDEEYQQVQEDAQTFSEQTENVNQIKQEIESLIES
ncbi:YkyA family protein [Salinicoccus roseus]|jgi:DNA repair exonuclease SbcCD ATPase subunit|uniref:YkyA family protein n=1 Tax=Salinicoccus roseus TaxID=45670 RepID=UPI001EF707B0|nr:YkyA family protein [Salinicoccus roseus]MCG7332365.1 YkyA family protein [Salinicoccus roseus]